MLAGVLQVVWLEQEDARLISPGEEVTLMDWGNAVVEVSPSLLCCAALRCGSLLHRPSLGGSRRFGASWQRPSPR